MKIFCHIPRENWIVDRMGLEYLNHSDYTISFDSITEDTDLIWLFASWCWNQIPSGFLVSKKVVCTIHHEVPEKFVGERKNNFMERDKFVDHYLTYTEKTKNLINSLSEKPVMILPHWVNTSIWSKLNKHLCKNELNIPLNKFIVGSFQRDTEGFDLKTPKLEKGPDIFVQKVIEISKIKDVHVILAGWRRQYVIDRLIQNKIDYSYFELPDNKIINKLYNSLDLYIVSSRCEGGPQALFECAYLKIPIITTFVGQHTFIDNVCKYRFDEIANKNLIKSSSDSIEKNYKNIEHLHDHKHIKNYDNFFKGLIK